MSRPPPDLPATLAAAIEARLEGRPQRALKASARRLSDNYRARKTTRATILDESDALAYALTRMPATYAAMIAALGRLREEQPDLAFGRLLDAGCGLGAGAYAAAAVWPGLAEITLLDRSRAFLAFAKALAMESDVAAMQRARMVEADLLRLPRAEDAPYDLVVVGYALTEIDDDALPALIDALWSQTGRALVIVEPGTPRDYRRLMDARARLIAQGAAVLAPCPHAAPCPMPEDDWCHSSVRLPRRRAHRLLKGAQTPFEDEKFSFLALARGGGPAAAARVIAPPRAGKTGVWTRLCTPSGISETLTAKRDKPRYERIRKCCWGDHLPAPAEDKE